MSDHDRGPYSPQSDRLSFDPREPRRSGGPAPVTLIVSAVILVGIIGAVFLVYRGGVRHRGDGAAVVGAPVGVMKTPAPADTSSQAPAGLVIDKTDTAQSNAAPAFAPPPETPQARPVEAAAVPPAPVKPVQVLPTAVAPTPVAASAGPPPPPGTATAAPPKPAALPKPAAPPKLAALSKPAAPMTIASLTDQALARKPAKPAAKPAAPTSAAAPAAGAGWVQIGAFSSPALADRGWSDIAKLAPASMAGKGKKVEELTRDGKSLYRAYITGFSTRDAAQAFCGKLKAAGKSCFVK